MASDIKTLDAALAERERVLRIIGAHEAELRALGVSRLWLFGSLVRGDAGAASDVDIMITIPRGRKFSLFDLGEVRVELCELLGPSNTGMLGDTLVASDGAIVSKRGSLRRGSCGLLRY